MKRCIMGTGKKGATETTQGRMPLSFFGGGEDEEFPVAVKLRISHFRGGCESRRTGSPAIVVPA